MKKKLIWLSIFLPGLLYLAKWLFEGTPIEGGAWSGGLTLTKIVNEFCAPILILVGATQSRSVFLFYLYILIPSHL